MMFKDSKFVVHGALSLQAHLINRQKSRFLSKEAASYKNSRSLKIKYIKRRRVLNS
jgi:hypothetical protein